MGQSIRCPGRTGSDGDSCYSRHLKQLLVDQLQRIHALLEFDVFIGELSPIFGLAQLLLDHLLRARSEGRKVRTISQSNNRLETCQQSGGILGVVVEEKEGEERKSGHSRKKISSAMMG